MSVNTIGKLRNDVSVRAIEEVIKQHYIHLETHLHTEESYFIHFKNGDNKRSLHIYIGYNYSTETEISKWLNLGYNQEAIEIIETIISYFGGWMTDNDCNQDYRWVNKTRELSIEKQKELTWKDLIYSKLNSKFTYDEIQKIVNNRVLLKDILLQSDKLECSNYNS